LEIQDLVTAYNRIIDQTETDPTSHAKTMLYHEKKFPSGNGH